MRKLVKSLALLIILLASVTACMRLLLPWYVSHPARVAELLESRLGTEVQLAASDLDLSQGMFPILHLQGLRLGTGSAALMLEQAEVELDLAAALVRYRPLVRELRLREVKLDIVYQNGAWRLLGLPAGGNQSVNAQWMQRLGALTALDVSLRLSVPEFDTHLSVSELNLELRWLDRQLRLSATTPTGVRAALEFGGEPGQFNAYVETDELDLGESQQRIAGIRPVIGQLASQLWIASGEDGLTFRSRGQWEQVALEGTPFLWTDGQALATRHSLPGNTFDLHGRVTEGDLYAVGHIGASTGQLLLPLRPPRDDAYLQLDGLSVDALARLATATSLLPEAARRSLYQVAPFGELESLQWQGATNGVGQARFRELGTQSSLMKVPSVGGLDGKLSFDRSGATFELDSKNVRLRQPGVFRESIPLALSSRGSLGRVGSDWWLEFDAIQVSTHSARLNGDAALLLAAGQQPEVDLRVVVNEGSIADARHFLPINVMPAKAVEWIDRALVSGRLEQGQILLRGPLGKPPWPYANGEGRFEAIATVGETTLDFHRDWPRAEALSARVRFINDGVIVEHASGTVSGNEIQVLSGSIPRFREPVLDLRLIGQGDAGDWLEFLRNSPVGTRHGSVLIGMHAEGPVSAAADVSLPLKRALGEAKLSGNALLEGITFEAAKWAVDFRETRGEAHFTRNGFHAKKLRVETPTGNSGSLAIAVGGPTGDPLIAVKASLTGAFSADEMFGSQDSLRGVLSATKGRSDWRVGLVAKRPAELEPLATSLTIASELKGIEVALPEPLGKPASVETPLRVSVAFSGDAAPQLSLSISERAHMQAELETPQHTFRARLRLGSGSPDDVPLPDRGLDIAGRVTMSDPMRWLPVLASGSGTDPVLRSVALDLDDQPGGYLRLNQNDGLWTLAVASPAFSGRAEQKREGDKQAIDIDFDRMYLPKPTSGAADLPRIDPRLLPTLHVRARELRLGDAQLGNLRLESFPDRDGLRIEMLESDSEAMKLRGSGYWRARGLSQESEFELQFSADDLGKFLRAMGFAEQITGSQSIANIKATWAGAPTDFSLERLNGTLDVWVGPGRFVEIDPGAGRLFGLFSLTALPRRLALDFRDFFQSGMAFDDITGAFALGEGNAWTENLKIKAPAAEILIIGRTGIAARDYDQQVMVSPRVSSVLPLVGALAAGPGGAAAGLLAQGVLSQDGSFQQEYRVGGSWEKPAIEKQNLGTPNTIKRDKPG